MNQVICHIAGPSGSGKTTLLKKIQEKFPNLLTKDLDEFDEEGSLMLNLDSVSKKEWSDGDLKKLADLRQKLMDQFLIAHEDRKVVLAGFHTEDKHVLKIPTEYKILLDVDAETSARRAYERSQNEKPKHRRKIEEMDFDIKEAQKEIDFLLSEGYIKMSEEEIFKLIEGAV